VPDAARHPGLPRPGAGAPAARAGRRGLTPSSGTSPRPPRRAKLPATTARRLPMLRLLPLLMLAGAPAPDTAMERLEALMRDYRGQVPGASVLVLRDGQPLVRRGWGLADLEAGIPAGPHTNYRLASVTKQFTAAAVLLLAEDGRLSLDDPVRRWLPSLPPAADAVTLRHLLAHTSGLIDYEDLMGDDWQGQIRDAGVLELLEKQDRLYFPAGKIGRYSNGAYALLALIVEKASGLDYPVFLEQRIFAPLGMHDTIAYVAGGPEVPNRAWGYSQVDGAWQRTDQSTTSAVL